MPYFSRLTDIVTCNLSAILDGCEDAEKALTEMLIEMKEGVAGAERSLRTSMSNVVRIEGDIASSRLEVASWLTSAQQALKANQDEQARHCLERKHELEDLIAGLEQQLQAAISTRDHLRTMLNAIQARYSEANRRLQAALNQNSPSGETGDLVAASSQHDQRSDSQSVHRPTRIDAELEELRRQLGK